MLKKFNRFLIALCLITSLFAVTVFAAEQASDSQNVQIAKMVDVEQVKTAAKNYVIEYLMLSAEDLKFVKENSVGTTQQFIEQLYTYVENDSLGKYDTTGQVTLVQKENGTIYEVVIPVQFEKGELTITLEMKFILDSLNIISSNVSFASAQVQSKGAVLQQAGLNTIIAISIVFLMLAFMSIIIAQFKYVDAIASWFVNKVCRILAWFKGEKAETPSESACAAVVQTTQTQVPEADDLELIAVITAAIAASEDAPAEGFTVRSIRRVKF